MIKRLILLFIFLQLLAGVALADKTTFTDGNPVTRAPGTRVTAAFLNGLNNHRHDGKNADGSGVLDYAVDTGSANAIVIALPPPALTAHVEGMPIWVKVGHDNTGPTTIAVDGLAAVSLYKNVGQELIAGDIRVGQVIGVSWAGSAYQLINYQNQPPPPVTDASTLNGRTAIQLVPPGAVMAFAMASAPDGWLICDGRAVLRSAFLNLFAAIGTTWGAGDSVSTFNLPDFRGEFLRGGDLGRGIDPGRAIGSWQADQFKSHTHSDGVYQYLLKPPYASSLTGTDNTGSGSEQAVGVGDGGPMLSVGGTETRPRNMAVLFCIKY